MSSTRPAQMDAAFGRNVSIRRGVNARDTSARNREWSGGSIERMPEVTRRPASVAREKCADGWRRWDA